MKQETSTKEKILDTALELFSEKGFLAVTTQEIAEKVGIKAPSLYKHYESKQAIFDAILDKINQRYKSQANVLTEKYSKSCLQKNMQI